MKITVKTTVNAPVEKVWQLWNNPDDITKWCSPSPEWHTPRSENDLREGGSFTSTMAARDGSMSFDFKGTYTKVDHNRFIAYTIEDGRKVEITFEGQAGQTILTETFDAENINPVEMQQGGWQAILDNFKKYAEAGV
ncbi:SRPBCC family protein [Flavobacterium pallidum]|uniref:Polyketide cyclase n=1 Tax=Flavobacterium pallidum TaxID=2172098 RepID=A0A2S1SHU5_9FLAO|nr:SRPBCC family protein [Flavobacterium pallidum]AWI25955.1 polyketide cyclase [Flavobacterium pallidum]